MLLAASACGQTLSFREEKLHGRRAWVLSNGIIRVSALAGGGHIAEVRFESAGAQGDSRRTVNPMRVPHYPTIEPYEYDPAKHDKLYGDGPHRWLSSGYMGHLLCFPSFGPPSSEAEVRSGLGNHGEAPIVEWRYVSHSVGADGVTFSYAAGLPKTQYRVGRMLTLRKGGSLVHVREWVENQQPFDRAMNWVQHATFGAPFAEAGKTYLDMPATRGEVGPRATGASLPPGQVQWGEKYRVMQPVERAGTYVAWLLDPNVKESWFTMYHADYPVLIGYLFPVSDNPWMGDWQENRGNTGIPWNGKAVARGMEFGTTPFAEGLRRSVERGKMFGVPTFRWIGGGQRLETEYSIFLEEIRSGFLGVAELKRDPAGKPVIRERAQ